YLAHDSRTEQSPTPKGACRLIGKLPNVRQWLRRQRGSSVLELVPNRELPASSYQPYFGTRRALCVTDSALAEANVGLCLNEDRSPMPRNNRGQRRVWIEH